MVSNSGRLMLFAVAVPVLLPILLVRSAADSLVDLPGKAGLFEAASDIDLRNDDERQADRGDAVVAGCAVKALQLRAARAGSADAAVLDSVSSNADELDEEGCHDMQEGEGGACMKSIIWSKSEGYTAHPDWYTGLNPATSTIAEWQLKAWNTSHPTCPRPCSIKLDDNWCMLNSAPELWEPTLPGSPMEIKILSYNLFWWNLFKIHGGRSASELIKRSGESKPFDVIGLQECEDTDKVFGPVGLLSEYTPFHDSDKNICIAFRTSAWTKLGYGVSEVAGDMHTEYYGRRSAQWIRLQHNDTKLVLFFVNHHGPLSVNSGGKCGGASTAHNLLKVMATNAVKGDTVVLVGDFNANAASRPVQSLWPKLLQVYNGIAFGGVDNIFSNVGRSSISSTEDLGSGGSDHHAIATVITLGGVANQSADLSPSSAVGAEPAFSVEKLMHAQGSDGCLIEPELRYAFASTDGPSQDVGGITDSRVCCRACMGEDWCKAWVWTEWSSTVKGPLCSLKSSRPTSSKAAGGFASGLPQNVAIEEARAKAAAAGF
mmetsp:Transcript_103705/g.332364  ORF Transcript_103705/g.332364 Transcript_103705/m.332364 type:complete len:544 (-) Transcript_103705:47-1678(-)